MSSAKELFGQLKDGLEDPEIKKTALKKGNAVFSFDFKGAGKYYIDLKDKGTAGEGAAPGKLSHKIRTQNGKTDSVAGKKADITLTMDEKTFLDLASGKGNAQKLFMQGKIKIKGNMMKATALGDILKTAQAQQGAPKAKL